MHSNQYKQMLSFILNDLDTKDMLKIKTLIEEKLKEQQLKKAAKECAKEYILKHGQDLGINKKHLDNKLEIIIG
jgi:hypothetical protein